MTSLNRERIISTSLTLIERPQKLTFSTLARELSVHSQALYAYFPNQDGLDQAIVASVARKVTDDCTRQAFGKTGREAITVFLTTVRDSALAHPEIARFTLNRMRNDSGLASQTDFSRLRDLFHVLLASMWTDKKQQIIAGRALRDVLIGDILNTINGWFTDRRVSPDESFKHILDGTFAWLCA